MTGRALRGSRTAAALRATRAFFAVGAANPIPWRYALRRTYHGFLRHRAIDAAASLSFFSTLALFPGALSLVSAVALNRNDQDAIDEFLSVTSIAIGPNASHALREPLTSLLSLSSPGASLAIGLVLALWSLSGYAMAFGRAIDAIYEVQEGRRFVAFRSRMMLLALGLMVAFAAMAAILLITPDIAAAIGEQYGLGTAIVLAWNITKWPVLAGLVVVVVGLLYYFTPNISPPRVRWVSYGALLAIGGWAVATLGFAVYVIHFSKYDRVYGVLGGAVVVLVYSYLSNLVLVLGAELDAQLIRVRFLQAGVEAEGTIPLPVRDNRRNLALARHLSLDLVDGRTIRLQAVRDNGDRSLDGEPPGRQT